MVQVAGPSRTSVNVATAFRQAAATQSEGRRRQQSREMSASTNSPMARRRSLRSMSAASGASLPPAPHFHLTSQDWDDIQDYQRELDDLGIGSPPVLQHTYYLRPNKSNVSESSDEEEILHRQSVSDSRVEPEDIPLDKVDSTVQQGLYVAIVILHFLLVQVKKHKLIASALALLILAWLMQRNVWMSSSDDLIKQNILRGTYDELKTGKSNKMDQEHARLSDIIERTKVPRDRSGALSEDYKAIQAQISATEDRLSDRISQLVIHFKQSATDERYGITELQGEVQLLVDSVHSVDGRIGVTEEALSKLHAGRDKLDQHLSKSSNKIDQLDDLLGRLAQDLERFREMLTELETKTIQNEGDTTRVRSEVRALQASHKHPESQMVTKDTLDEAVAKLLQSNLPTSMPILAGSVDGEYTIDPDFWRYLKTLILKEVVGETKLKVPTWETFVSQNTANLENWVDRRVKKMATQDMEMIDRSVFILEIQKQMNSLREEFTEHLSESRTLANRAVQQAMEAKAGIRRMVGTASSGNASAILDIVQHAISNLESDLYRQYNLASFEDGARIIPEWTSETLRAERQWLFWGKLGFKQRIDTSSPVDCLSDDVPDQQCWAFGGNQGQIGIQLNQPSLVRGITVEGCYDASNVQGVSRAAAPMDMELWGIVDAELIDATEVADRQRLTQQGFTDDANRVQGQLLQHSQAGSSTDLRMKRDHILFGKFVYDGRYVDKSGVRQTWQVAIQAREFDIPVQALKLRIDTNWGDQQFTCLHRIKIHGVPKVDWQAQAKVMEFGDAAIDDNGRD